ncbi:MAG: Hsp20/alpha crystallin family protein [Candidatus Wallbacteria bacterium]|nr:Hsp20/alpha crystallin family protein [Candidatus Wallbacteria bacterium]
MFGIIRREKKNDLPAFDQLAREFFNTDLWETGYRYPAVDIYEKDKIVHIDAEVPGLDKEDIKVELEEGILSISGETKAETEEKDKNYFRTERRYGTFKRTFTLGDGVDETGIQAKFDNGILKVLVPLKEIPKKEAKLIEVK